MLISPWGALKEMPPRAVHRLLDVERSGLLDGEFPNVHAVVQTLAHVVQDSIGSELCLEAAHERLIDWILQFHEV